MKPAVLDESLTARVVSERPLVYTRPASPGEDRPDHVRAASALAMYGNAFLVIQDDASFLAFVDGDDVAAIAIPHVVAGRARFEPALGNKLDKLDLEACVMIGHELFAFGSGSLPVRERILVCRRDEVILFDSTALYAALREAIGGPVNLEGAALVHDELWLFHRGNASASDRPAVARIPRDDFPAIVRDSAAPTSVAIDRYDLGAASGVRFGFTDATSSRGRVLIACAAEASDGAISDGAVIGSRIGVIEEDVVRCANVVGLDGSPLKVEGLVLDPARPGTAWITIDPDDPKVPARLCEVLLGGTWRF